MAQFLPPQPGRRPPRVRDQRRRRRAALGASFRIDCSCEPLEDRALPSLVGPVSFDFATANPRSVAVGDFNGDGRPDLATANSDSDGTVSVLLGNGDGTFQPARSSRRRDHPVRRGGGRLQRRRPARPRRGQRASRHRQRAAGQRRRHLPGRPQLRRRDVLPCPWRWGTSTATACPDLAVANVTASNVSVLLGNGDGTFQAARNFAVGSGPSFRGGGGLQRRRPPRPRRGESSTATPSACCWATATAPSRPPATSPSARTPVPWRWGTSTATAGPTSPWRTARLDGARQRQRAAGQRRRHLPGRPPLRRRERSPCPWRWRTSTATAAPTSPWPTLTSRNVSVLLGNGDGTFQAARNFAVGAFPVPWRWGTSTATAASTSPWRIVTAGP